VRHYATRRRGGGNHAPTRTACSGPGGPAELRQALANPGQLPTGELDNAVEYNDESEETFLRRLWRDLYGDEPI